MADITNNVGEHMAIALEFIDFIVPIATIGEKYPGGWAQCLRDHNHLNGKRVWFDEHLLRNGAMSPIDINHEVVEPHTTHNNPSRLWWGQPKTPPKNPPPLNEDPKSILDRNSH